jgi:acyl-CoA reductase-like NAD-dependent aldehyde dehydrogenase
MNSQSGLYRANQFIHERYVPFRAEHGKRLSFESADYRVVCSPYDGAPIATIGFMTEAQAHENLAILRRTFLDKKQPPAYERAQILKRAARKIESHLEAFADLIAWEGGKPLKDARIEVIRAVNSLELAAEEAVRVHGEEIPMRGTKAAAGHMAFTYLEPIGVVLAISAFNHPLNLIAHQVGPAIAAGCPVLVKPAAETPLTCFHFLEALYDAGLPPEMALALIADNEIVEKIAASNQIGFLTFIGSSKVGWHLRSVVHAGTRFSLEHGGAAPVIVDESANLDEAVPTLIKHGYYHSGQVCVSTQRIFVHEKIMGEFAGRFVAGVKTLVTGDPRRPETDCGPLIRGRDVTRIGEWVSLARQSGAKLHLGGEPQGESCYKPTVLADVALNERVMREEVFGPVVCINTFRDFDEAIQAANDVPWSFQAAVFSRDLDRALKAVRGLNASAVMVNEGTAFRVDWMPFRGAGLSGFGTGGIGFSIRDMMSEKLVVIKSPSIAP